MNTKEVDSFRKMYAQVEAFRDEMVTLSKKNAASALGALKLSFTNTILANARKVLGSSAPELGFQAFDGDDLPSVSDVSFVAAQFLECAEKVRCENIGKLYGQDWYWRVDGQYSDIDTSAPRGVGK
jgi:hypothetical protein